MPVKFPKNTFNIVPGDFPASPEAHRVLAIGQRLSGSKNPGEIVKDIPNDGSEDVFFGKQSHLAGVVRQFKKANKVSPIDAIVLNDAPLAAKSSAKLVFSTRKQVMASVNGTTWTLQTSSADIFLTSLVYGNGVFVAVSSTGVGNRVMTSPDGVNWTSRTSAADNNWQSITFGNGLFVAVSDSGVGNRVMTSPDGINWTIRTSAADNNWRSVTFANGLFVAVSITGSGNRVMTSPDGINWTIRTSAADNNWRSVTFANGLFVAVSSSATGLATEDSQYKISVGSKKRYSRTVDVSIGDSGSDIASSVEAAFSDAIDATYSVEASSDSVIFTAKNGGTLANKWGIEVSGNISGVSRSIFGWEGGTTTPSLTGVLDQTGEQRYHTVIWPESYDIDVIKSFLDDRFNSENGVLDGVAVQVKSDTFANLKAYVAPINSQSVNIIGQLEVNSNDHKGGSSLEMPDEISAYIAGIRALRLTDDSSLTQFLTTTASLDQFGGMGISSLPYANTSLPDLSIPFQGKEFNPLEMSELVDSGVSVFGANKAYNGVILGEQVTTYLTDNAGNPDTSYHLLNTVDQASAIRAYYSASFDKEYAQTRLTNGDLSGGRGEENIGSIRSFCKKLYSDLSNLSITEKGADALADFDENMVVSIDTLSGTATVNIAPLLVGQYRATIATIKINFGG